ncbi:hypothetical protein D3C86_1932140 [compost metagenome]
MADEQQPRTVARTLSFAPDIRPAGTEICRLKAIQTKSAHFFPEIGDEIGLVAGDALAPDGAAEKRDRRIAIQSFRQAGDQVVRHRHRATSCRAVMLARGNEIRPSGASTPNNVLCS